MLKVYSFAVFVALGLILPHSIYSQTNTLRFAWPDGASAKVNVRSAGKQVARQTDTWDMSCDFTMNVKRVNDQIVVSRSDYSGWKGTLAPPLGAGAEQFVDMVPTLIATKEGNFVGIEGHETARKLMAQAVEKAGHLSQLERTMFETISSNASLEALSRQQWYGFVVWTLVELDPNAIYEFQSAAKVPQLGGGEININGTIKFVKETPCEPARDDQRCVHLHSESGGDKAQVRKIIQSLLQNDPNPVTVTDWDQQVKVDMVLEKKTMLPRQLKITRFHSLTVTNKASGQNQTSGGEYSATYTFTWVSAP